MNFHCEGRRRCFRRCTACVVAREDVSSSGSAGHRDRRAPHLAGQHTVGGNGHLGTLQVDVGVWVFVVAVYTRSTVTLYVGEESMGGLVRW